MCSKTKLINFLFNIRELGLRLPSCSFRTRRVALLLSSPSPRSPAGKWRPFLSFSSFFYYLLLFTQSPSFFHCQMERSNIVFVVYFIRSYIQLRKKQYKSYNNNTNPHLEAIERISPPRMTLNLIRSCPLFPFPTYSSSSSAETLFPYYSSSSVSPANQPTLSFPTAATTHQVHSSEMFEHFFRLPFFGGRGPLLE